MKETQIEAKLVRKVRALGGMCFKFTSPGNPGVPDRLILLPGGRVVFTELKTGVGRLSAVQKWQIGEMQKRGADVRVLRGLEAVNAFVEEVSQDGVYSP